MRVSPGILGDWPPLKEQEEIVRRVNGLFALADKIETRYNTVQQQVDRLPLSILTKAFRGEIVPTEAELAEREGRPYESVEESLKRIRLSKENTVMSSANKRPREWQDDEKSKDSSAGATRVGAVGKSENAV